MKVWGSMKTITARYHQSVENHQKESLQDLTSTLKPEDEIILNR